MGSTFRLVVTLPEAEPDGIRPDPAGPPELRGLRMLVLAPDDLGRASVVEQLRSWGSLVEAVSSPTEARIRLFDESWEDRPGVLIVDDAMSAEVGRLAPLGERLPRVLVRRPGAGGPARTEQPDSLTVSEPIRRSALREAILRALRPEAIVSAPPSRSPLPSFGLRVLVAEDFETNRELVCQMLRLLGCRAEAVPDGRLAVEAAVRDRFDLVLMDLEMPGLDGLQATAEIRFAERGKGRYTPIFAFTAHALEEDHRRCRDLGMDGILTKPIRMANLHAFLSEFLSSRSGRNALTPV
ncbi:response regulator [Tautonia sociabilis]|uniref:response regulator n=1 Tax=Tautonia sociabilis TaxID=2080755 RepID=UPI001F1F4EE2|nr:response regulator [Tautonia sociabilis]